MDDNRRSRLEPAIAQASYELQQLVDLAALEIVKVQGESRGVFLRSSATVEIACLEAGLLHVRNLLDFLDRGNPKHITARDFVGVWSPPASESLKRLRSVRDALNVHLSHLTWERVKVAGTKNPEWSVPALAEDVLTVFTDFVARYHQVEGADDRTVDWFDIMLAQASIKLRQEWPHIVPEPAPGSPLRAYVPAIERRDPGNP